MVAEAAGANGQAREALDAFVGVFQTGLVAVDEHHGVVCANAAARQFIAESMLLSIDGDRLRLSEPAAHRNLIVAITLALDGDEGAPAVWLHRAHMQRVRRVFLLARPLILFGGQFSLVWIIDVDRARDGPANLAARAGLTRREVEMLDLLTSGLDVTAISKRMAVAIPTVRSHLQKVFGKLQVESQAQVVRVALAASSF